MGSRHFQARTSLMGKASGHIIKGRIKYADKLETKQTVTYDL